MWTTSGVIAILSIMVIARVPETLADSSEMGNTSECHRKLSHHIITKKDKMGRKCSGWVAVWGCQGRCESYVLGDWRFGSKLYFHPVCIHGQRVQSVEILRNCDEGVAPGTERYEYVEAGDCRCSICNSSETSCEGAHKRGPPTPPAEETNDDTDDVIAPVETAEPQSTHLNRPPLPLNDVVYPEEKSQY